MIFTIFFLVLSQFDHFWSANFFLSQNIFCLCFFFTKMFFLNYIYIFNCFSQVFFHKFFPEFLLLSRLFFGTHVFSRKDCCHNFCHSVATFINVTNVTTVTTVNNVTIVKYQILLLYSSKGNFFTEVLRHTNWQLDV